MFQISWSEWPWSIEAFILSCQRLNKKLSLNAFRWGTHSFHGYPISAHRFTALANMLCWFRTHFIILVSECGSLCEWRRRKKGWEWCHPCRPPFIRRGKPSPETAATHSSEVRLHGHVSLLGRLKVGNRVFKMSLDQVVLVVKNPLPVQLT